jgi:hypothetical protein
LQHLQLVPLRIQRADKVVEGVEATTHTQIAAVGQLVARRECGRHGATDLGDVNRVYPARGGIDRQRPAVTAVR